MEVLSIMSRFLVSCGRGFRRECMDFMEFDPTKKEANASCLVKLFFRRYAGI
jgi:hypothetical protein